MVGVSLCVCVCVCLAMCVGDQERVQALWFRV